jgi:hypothetical protein
VPSQARSAGCAASAATLRLFVFSQANSALSGAMPSCGATSGGIWRQASPWGGSTLITSAPKSANSLPA